jgi:hypothetical protein
MGENGSKFPPRGSGGGNKPGPPGISQDDARRLTQRVEKVERQLADHYAEKNQWNSMVREWVGSAIVVQLSGDHNLEGILLWVDRYTLCIEACPPVPGGPSKDKRPIIVHKGLVAFMYQR